MRWKGTLNLNGHETGKERSLATESCQEKSVQEKDREEPAKEKELQTAAEVKHHCLKGVLAETKPMKRWNEEQLKTWGGLVTRSASISSPLTGYLRYRAVTKIEWSNAKHLALHSLTIPEIEIIVINVIIINDGWLFHEQFQKKCSHMGSKKWQNVESREYNHLKYRRQYGDEF